MVPVLVTTQQSHTKGGGSHTSVFELGSSMHEILITAFDYYTPQDRTQSLIYRHQQKQFSLM